jgi:site-specific recombinase XerD
MELMRLLDRAEQLASGSIAFGTRKGYSDAWLLFAQFCAAYGFAAEPAGEEAIFAFVAWLEIQGKGRRASHHVAAISWVHRRKGLMDFTKATRVRMALQGVARVEAEEKMEVRSPFPLEALKAWVRGRRKNITVREHRDPALVALGIRCMRRPGELAELKVRHVQPYEKGMKIFLAKSKTDQTMEGRWLHVDAVPGSDTCPVLLLAKYLGTRGKLHHNEPLFASSKGRHLSSSAVSSVVRNMATAAGRTEKVSGHSLRIAGATLAVRGGMSMPEICAIGGWKSEAVLRYLRDCAVAQRGGSALMGF